MIEEQGQVVAVEGDSVWVETVRKSTCSGCSAHHGCGQGLSSKYQSNASLSYIRAFSPFTLQEGDRVIVGIPEGVLMKASMLVYLIPMLSMMVSLWLSELVGFSDAATMLFVVIGLALGFVPVKWLGQRAGDMCRVDVLRGLQTEGGSDHTLAVRDLIKVGSL
ncbi:MAG: SoxR reducing system RseC family protein [Endozoicomonas sp.]